MLKIALHPLYAHPLPEGHRFPMLKYELIPEQLVRTGLVNQRNFFKPERIDMETLLLTHSSSYVNDLLNLSLDASHIRRIGFPLTPQLIERELIITQGAIDCAEYALQNGVALNVAGGTHHAFADKGEGFCLLNDIAVAANHLLYKKLARQILIIDLDVHQGNGTASLFAKKPEVFTFSMHGRHNYPFFKEKSDIDVALYDGTADEEYLKELKKHLELIQLKCKPDFVFYLAGVDILETDKFGKLKVSMAGCRQRDEMVFDFCRQLNLPVAVSMGGGYSPKIADIVNAHCQTFASADKIFYN
jgi:acetoin utilization deacetylase AcuC-like enzyme